VALKEHAAADAPERHDPPSSQRIDAPPLSDRGALAGLALVTLAAFVLILYLGRGEIFYFDEWNFVLDRRGHTAGAFLEPHNEHIVVVPVIIYKLLLQTSGLAHHWPYLMVLALMHLGVGLGVFLLIRPRLGPLLALILAALILFMGLAWQNMLWAFQIGFVGSVLGGIWAWVGLDRRSTGGDVAACVALVLGTASSSLGVPLAIGIGAELLVARRAKALWVALIPLGLYALWYLGYGKSTITGEGLFHAVSWAVAAVAAAAGAPLGLGTQWGVVLAIVGVVALGWRLTVEPPTPRLLGLLIGGGGFWLLTGAARSVTQPAVSPDSSRYLTLGGVIVVLLSVEIATSVPAVRAWRPSVAIVAYSGLLALVAIALGLPVLRDNGRQLRAFGQTNAAELGAMELSRARVPASYELDPASAPQVTAGRYLSAIDAFGSSPAYTPAQLEGAPAAARVQADRVLQEINVHVLPARRVGNGGPAPDVVAAGARVDRSGGCSVLRPLSGSAVTGVATLPKIGLAVRALGAAPIELRLHRFADDFSNAPLAAVPRGQPQQLQMPADASSHPYAIQVSGTGAAAVCSVR
jgi:hypothetical protein